MKQTWSLFSTVHYVPLKSQQHKTIICVLKRGYNYLSESKSIPIGPKVTRPRFDIKSSLKTVLLWLFKAGRWADAERLIAADRETSPAWYDLLLKNSIKPLKSVSFCCLVSYLSNETPCFKKCGSEMHLKVFENLKNSRKWHHFVNVRQRRYFDNHSRTFINIRTQRCQMKAEDLLFELNCFNDFIVTTVVPPNSRLIGSMKKSWIRNFESLF